MHGAHVRMVIEIADQEDARGRKRCNHACAMQPDLLARDQRPARRDQDRAGAVQRGIHRGEDAVVRHYAAGSVRLRLATTNPARKTTAAKIASTAIEGHKLSVVGGAVARNSVSSRASMP